MLPKTFLFLFFLPFIISAPRNGLRSQDEFESLSSPPSLPTNDPPSSSLTELEAKLNERMRIIYSDLSSRMDTIEEAIHQVHNSNEKGEWLERDDKSSYRLHEERRKWKEAQSICQSEGASLVTVDSEGENGFVTQIVKTKPHIDFVWLKMKNRPKVTPIDVQFSNITDKDQHNQCTVICSDSSWALRSCDQLRPFICKRDPPLPPKSDSDEEDEKKDEVSIDPTLKQPIQPWKNNQMHSALSGAESLSYNRRSQGDHKSTVSPKRALDFLFE